MRLSLFLASFCSLQRCVVAQHPFEEVQSSLETVWQQTSDEIYGDPGIERSSNMTPSDSTQSPDASRLFSYETEYPTSAMTVGMKSIASTSADIFQESSAAHPLPEQISSSSALPTTELTPISPFLASTPTIMTASTTSTVLLNSLTDSIVVPILHEDAGRSFSSLRSAISMQTVAYSSNESPDPYLAAIAYETSSSGRLPEDTEVAHSEGSSSDITSSKGYSRSAVVQSTQTTDHAPPSNTRAQEILSLLTSILKPTIGPETSGSTTVKRFSEFLGEVLPSLLSLPTVAATSRSDSVLERRSEATSEVVQTTPDRSRQISGTTSAITAQTASANSEQVSTGNSGTQAIDSPKSGSDTHSELKVSSTTTSLNGNVLPTPAISSPPIVSDDASSNVAGPVDFSLSPTSETSILTPLPSTRGNAPMTTNQATGVIISAIPDTSAQKIDLTDTASAVKATDSVLSAQTSAHTQSAALSLATGSSNIVSMMELSSTESVLAQSQPSPFNRVASVVDSSNGRDQSLSVLQATPTQSNGFDAAPQQSETSSNSVDHIADISTPYLVLPQVTSSTMLDLSGEGHSSITPVNLDQTSMSTNIEHTQQTALAALSTDQAFMSGGTMSLSGGTAQPPFATSVSGLTNYDEFGPGLTSTTSKSIESIDPSTQGISQAQEISATGTSSMLSSATSTSSMDLPSMSLAPISSTSTAPSASQATETEASMFLPPLIVTAQIEPTGQSSTLLTPSVSPSATAVAVSLPGAIAPATGMTLPSAAQVIVQIGFTAPLNYPFVVSNALTTAQIFSYLPKALAEALSIAPDTIISNSLRPFQQSNYTATVAYVVIPKNQQATLGQLIITPNSALYSQSDDALQSLVNLIDPSIPLLPDSGRATATRVATTTATTAAIDGNLANYGSLADITPASATGSSTQRIAGIGGGAAIAASAYACLMFFVVRRYRARSHQIARPLSSTSRRGLNSLRTGRAHLPISSPTNVENSLGI